MSGQSGKLPPDLVVRGVQIFEKFLDDAQQQALLEDLRKVVSAAPLFTPITAHGKEMSVRMTSAGKLGWVSGENGYRYEATHPRGMAWPSIPDSVLDIWRVVGSALREPDCCLINFYDATARMGLHQDRDEANFSWPVVSVSLGDDALFRIGNQTRGGKTESIWLRSGDVVVMGDEARLAYHGVDRIKAGTSLLLPKGGRINLTLRVVT
ncbi:alkylated DNA repair protein (DNA oxidative demethylase) [Litoreibacter meonggei]|uniref:Alkylated DNA repair protein (DNA oxidative demethylase) n=1 Tax=Litoreibacter meonggei TaxID=1049199 RepID=A0A497WM12_9RHOB|nr:alpha-ketoglutarate-dependent dioxygenase AlkB [Litoreibacter meonggei]RLJ52115.1 alkylated DNA repair protein (DNA oxidative demethylase) [Litoreibacter meonggei]